MYAAYGLNFGCILYIWSVRNESETQLRKAAVQILSQWNWAISSNKKALRGSLFIYICMVSLTSFPCFGPLGKHHKMKLRARPKRTKARIVCTNFQIRQPPYLVSNELCKETTLISDLPREGLCSFCSALLLEPGLKQLVSM